jgi:hypothetical protein
MKTEESVDTPPDKQKRLFLAWAITATVAALVFGNVALILFVRLRAARQEAAPLLRAQAASEATPPPALHPPQGLFPEEAAPAYPTRGALLTRPINASFTNLVESDVAGRYRFFEEEGVVGIIALRPDHTMINKDGMSLRQYRWAIQADGILTTWRRFNILFNDIEKPGVYVARRENGAEYSRLEKVQE